MEPAEEPEGFEEEEDSEVCDRPCGWPHGVIFSRPWNPAGVVRRAADGAAWRFGMLLKRTMLPFPRERPGSGGPEARAEARSRCRRPWCGAFKTGGGPRRGQSATKEPRFPWGPHSPAGTHDTTAPNGNLLGETRKLPPPSGKGHHGIKQSVTALLIPEWRQLPEAKFEWEETGSGVGRAEE